MLANPKVNNQETKLGSMGRGEPSDAETAYPGGVNSVALLFVAAACGLVAGVVATYAALRGSRPVPEPAKPVIPEPTSEVLSILSSAYVLLDSSGDVLRASPLAYSYGLVRTTGGDYPRLAHRDLIDIVTQVSRQGGFREQMLTNEKTTRSDQNTPTVVSVRVGALSSSRRILVLADDLSKQSRVEETRRDFVANVSHELKTPVGALTLLAETMEDAADDPEAVRRFASRMQTESRRLSLLVQEIIELSRVQGAQSFADASTVDVDSVIAEAVALNQNLASGHGMTIQSGGTQNLEVFGSSTMLTTALSNLIMNAITYSPPNTLIGVSTRSHNGMVEISVKDEGIGISPENMERIFERFYRVDKARSRATGGTGLGLSIVKHIASNHGGEVTVWSKEGSGSTFTLRIPELADDSPRDLPIHTGE